MNIWELVTLVTFFFALFEAIAIFALARSIGTIQLGLGGESAPLTITSEGLAVSALAPSLTQDEEAAGFWSKLPLRIVVVFLSASCSVCRDLAAFAPQIAKRVAPRGRLIVVLEGSDEQVRILAAQAEGATCIADPSGILQQRFGVQRTPFAFVVIGGRIAGKGVVNVPDQIEMLLDLEIAQQEHAWKESPVAMAPELETGRLKHVQG